MNKIKLKRLREEYYHEYLAMDDNTELNRLRRTMLHRLVVMMDVLQEE